MGVWLDSQVANCVSDLTLVREIVRLWIKNLDALCELIRILKMTIIWLSFLFKKKRKITVAWLSFCVQILFGLDYFAVENL